MLHTLHSSPFNGAAFTNCLRYAQPQSDILLLEDGVIAAIKNSAWQQQIKNTGLNIYALKEDLEARGLLEQVARNIKVIDIKGFISLTERHDKQLKW